MDSPFLIPPMGRPTGLDPASAATGRSYSPPLRPADIFRAELLAGGLPAHVVDGIMMNGRDESGFDPAAVGDNGSALGILQWNGPRMKALKEFAASLGGEATDPLIQAKFTLHELQGPEKAAYARLMATKTAGEAGAAFVNHFERPAEEHRARREAEYLGSSGSYDSGNALAAPPASAPNGSQNALAPQRPQLQWADMRQGPSAFMNRNALTGM